MIPTFEFFGRYPTENPTKPTPDPYYTYSPDTPDPHQDSSSNKELQDVTLKEPLYLIPNTEVDQLHHHTQAYLESIDHYQIPRSRASQRRNRPYSEDETLTSNIDDLIVDTILDIRHNL